MSILPNVKRISLLKLDKTSYILFGHYAQRALMRHGGLVNQKNGDAVAYRVNPSAAGAPE